jgi:TetR/AcrR family transcriptional regulator, regulator of mycofactocin system
VVGVSRGRPPSTTHDELADLGLRLFVERGFDETTVDDIAAEAGIARRTFFAYYPSKNDVVYGDFGGLLEAMRSHLFATPPDVPLLDAVREAVVAFNRIDPSAAEAHRARMRLILHTPALQAHSTLRYAAWRGVVADFAADRLGCDVRGLEPQLIAHTALGAAMAAYEQWLLDPASELEPLLDEALRRVADGLAAVRA